MSICNSIVACYACVSNSPALLHQVGKIRFVVEVKSEGADKADKATPFVQERPHTVKTAT